MKKYKLVTILFLIISIIITSGFTKISNKPQTLYRVYIKGESIGLIKSKVELEKVANNPNTPNKTNIPPKNIKI